MSAVVLELDIGNSSAKWRVLAPERLAGGRIVLTDSALRMLLDEHQISAIRVGSVAGKEVEDMVSDVARSFAIPCYFARSQPISCGLTNSYQDPSKMGVDRWLAMLAAWRLVQSEVIVVDAGTALTIDLIDRNGCHSGGYILPGRKLILESLTGSTERVRYEGVPDPSIAPGVTTAECVEHGSWLSLLSAIRGVVADCCQLSGGMPRVVLTGGDAPSLMRLAGDSDWQLKEELVLDGLALALADEEPEG
ncbi:MAG: type III pantothenate kinase [Spongiibacter marinus]|jgi:type III pantothenate kinase|uniref:type III pantothenate kinase n=1 Tax=Spongiibacter marinus TaxID=354246 RepID=UPI0032B296AB|tara:strand:+ start:2259 stop:3005 length:747 start_codon:yes stop_codon:yes gene_type:complete